ncbi:hypothetical protein AKJ64_02925 [candidate division MSBL1 archaeon SCGC-AAA259E17]|uniref:TsaA-like domain-containing protein n=1 Tax=candidate division MSBL1 archaeon SCGC-AAA259E17 TaxID=1698263 RepID=A0A133UEC1_9EURY|nr:hypothetical protein AKJ64_02925 [candidate division MSBL1 archaeon SCGC-AAA259E17]
MEIPPIGRVHKTESADIMKIEVHPELAEGLKDIDSLEKIDVCYWMHKLDEEERKKLKVHPRGNLKNPLTGVFALRSPMRPNPIGVTKVKLVRREDNNLFVEGLDAYDGSPVLDIKGG